MVTRERRTRSLKETHPAPENRGAHHTHWKGKAVRRLVPGHQVGRRIDRLVPIHPDLAQPV